LSALRGGVAAWWRAQVQMAVFSLYNLLDKDGIYCTHIRQLVIRRQQALYAALGEPWRYDPPSSHHYTTLDFAQLCEARHGAAMVAWLRATFEPIDVVVRLALRDGIILLPGRGFEAPDWCVRVSLANLPEAAYTIVGRAILEQMGRYNDLYMEAQATAQDEPAAT